MEGRILDEELIRNYDQENFVNEDPIRVQETLYSNENTTNSEFIKSYSSNVKLYGISFQNNRSQVRLGVSSIETHESNVIEVVEYDSNIDKLKRTAFADVEFPCTKILWSPSRNNNSVLATTSDFLRLYKYNENSEKISLATSLKKNQQTGNFCGPLTSMDWNKENSSILGVCSIDTTCTIWDLTKNEVKTSIIAHDKEVYDISFCRNENVFITTGGDGSVRVFDTRALDSCSIIFESQDNYPLTRVSWNLNNPYFIAALGLDKNIIYIIDQRITNNPYAFLNYHTNVVNAVSWAPNSNAHICSVGDDKNALIWDIQLISNRSEEPLMAFNSDYEIENVSWSESNDEWIGITGSNNLQILKVK